MGENLIEERKEKIKSKLFSWMKDNYDKLFIIVLITAIIIRFWIFLDTMDQPLWFDAASFLATAKKWGLGLNITEVWYYRRGLFWPVFCAMFFKLGLGEKAIRFTEVLFSTGIVVVSYILIKEMFNKKLALLASLGLTLSWVILFFTGRPMTSIPASFFLLLSLLFFWKGYELKQGNKFLYLFSLFYALSILTRMQYLMFAPIFLIYFFVKEKFRFLKNKNLWIALLIFILMFLPTFIMYAKHFGNPIQDVMSHYFSVGETSTIERSFFTLFDFFKDLPYVLTGKMFPSFINTLLQPLFLLLIIGSIYFFLDLLLGFDRLFENKNIQKKFFVFLWIVLPLLFLGYITNVAEQRYVIPILPFLFLIISFGLLNIGNFLFKQLKFDRKYLTFLVFILMIFLLIPNFSFADNLIDSKKTSYLEIKQAGLWIKENSNPNDLVISSSYPQASYYSERSINAFTEKGNPEDKKHALSEEEFTEFVQVEKPRYLILYAYQPHPEWVPSYLQNHSEWVPVRAYPSSEQPILVIYELKDNQMSIA